MGDPVHYLTCYAVVPLTDCRMTSTAPTRDAVVGSMQLPSGPHRPGDRLGPTSGGSIGSQGMWDPVYYFALCSAVPAIHWHMAECYVAL